MKPSNYSLPIFWLAVAVVSGWVVHLLSPYLAPFVTAAILGYIGAPLVGRLERLGAPRGLGASLVLLLITSLVTASLALLVPIVTQQAAQLAKSAPAMIAHIQGALQSLAPGLAEVDLATLRSLVAERPELIDKDILKAAISYIGGGLDVFLLIVMNGALVPLILFYVLRDWNRILASIDQLFPRANAERIRGIVRDCDAVLGEFLRAQLLVIIIMVAVYSTLLSLVGIKFAFAIATLAGVFTFVPYFGFLLGLGLGLLVAWTQGGGLGLAGAVAAAMTVGTAIESFGVTPLIVGKRIGLHPAVILLVLAASGGLFGFVGILLAVPVGAVVMVLLRHARDSYLKSKAYQP